MECAAAWRRAQEEVSVGIDLVATAKRQLAFLASIDEQRELLEDPRVLARAIYRYTNFWLPLAAEVNEEESGVVPPLDCAWVWHCHKLNPVQYARDCHHLFGKLVDVPHLDIEEGEQEKARKLSKMLWEQKYGLKEPYDWDAAAAAAADDDDDSALPAHPLEKRSCAYDLAAAVARQKSFFRQVWSPHFLEEGFLREAEERYKAFLYLAKKTKKEENESKEEMLLLLLVPTYDIDVMWHSHQLSPKAYQQDMISITGFMLNHDDTHTRELLASSFCGTQELWMQTFGDVPYQNRYMLAAATAGCGSSCSGSCGGCGACGACGA